MGVLVTVRGKEILENNMELEVSELVGRMQGDIPISESTSSGTTLISSVKCGKIIVIKSCDEYILYNQYN